MYISADFLNFMGELKTLCEQFSREMSDLGPIPASGPELDRYYAKILDLDQTYLGHTEKWIKPDSGPRIVFRSDCMPSSFSSVQTIC